MKKIIVLLVVLLLSFSLTIPTFAAVNRYPVGYNTLDLPMWDLLANRIIDGQNSRETVYPYALIFWNYSTSKYHFYVCKNPASYNSDTGKININNGFEIHTVHPDWDGESYDPAWQLWASYPASSTSIDVSSSGDDLIISSHYIYDQNGKVAVEAYYGFWPYGYMLDEQSGRNPSDAPVIGEPSEDEDGGILGFLGNIRDAILNLPSTIANSIKNVFVPDAAELRTKLVEFSNELKRKFSFDTTAFEALFVNETPIDDVEVDYTIQGVGDFKFKVLDAEWLVWGVEKLRPYLKGFLVLLIMLYNIRQLIGFFGYDAGVVAGRNETIKAAREGKGG